MTQSKIWIRGAIALLCASAPLLFARSIGPNIKYTGAPGDQNCTACHRGLAVNPDTVGRVQILTANYRPGQRQTVRVTVEHPEATRWGFQLTARVGASTLNAGTMVANSNTQVRCDNGTPAGVAPPCADGVQQFIEHTTASTAATQRNAQTWEFEWQAPAEEVGDVVFYVAANAANNDNANTGDRIYTTLRRVQPDATCSLTDAPAIQSIFNAATGQAGLAPGACVSIRGSGFAVSGTRRIAGPGDIRDNAFVNELRCIAVEVNGQRAPLTYVQPDQINLQLPQGISGNISVRVLSNAGRPNQQVSPTATGTLAAVAPAFFTFNGTSIAALFTDFSIVAESSVVPTGRPVRPGDIVLLYATGLGPTNPAVPAGQISAAGLTPLTQPVRVNIGGVEVPAADILYAGVAPSSISGLYQLNVRTPANLPPGNLPVVITVGGVNSPSATLPFRALN